MKWIAYRKHKEQFKNMKNFEKINVIGYYSCIFLALAFFLSIQFQRILGIWVSLLFLIAMIFRSNRLNLKKILDKKILYGMLIFIGTPYIIAIIDGGISARLDMDDYIKFLLFFPLVFFLNSKEKIFEFLKTLLVGAGISLLITLGIFVKNYDTWKNPIGFQYDRIFFELPTQDFANIMCIVLLFLISFICFYRIEDKSKNLKIKIVLFALVVLDNFILLVNRSKMVYICLIPTIIYILWKKNKKYILSFLAMCFSTYFILPKAISDRLQYIIKFKQDPSSNLRLIFWDGAIKVIKKSPIIGMQSKERLDFTREYYKQKGVYEYIMTFYPEFEKHNMKNGLDTHNMYLQYWVYFGVGFISLILLFFIIIPSRLIKMSYYKMNKYSCTLSKYVALEIALKASFICYLIQGTTEINLNNQSMIIAFVMLLCMINFMYKNEKLILKKENELEIL